MRDVIIFSGSDLIRFALRQIIEPVIVTQPSVVSATIKVCSTLLELESLVLNSHNPLVIFDVDNISMFDQFRFFKLIEQSVNKKSLILYSKDIGLSNDYAFSNKIYIVYLPKKTEIPKIEIIIRDCLYGQESSLSEQFRIHPRTKPKSLKLTKREKQILSCLLTGMSTEEISILFGISKSTINTHKMHIFKKYGVSNLAQFYYKYKCSGLLNFSA